MKSPYDDIIHLPRHVSPSRPPMPIRDRAAQFSPFAALTDYEEVIGETGRQTESRRELDAQEQCELDRRISFLASHLPERPEVTIEFFVPDERKSGGSYRVVHGAVKAISIPARRIVMQSGEIICADDISAISGHGSDREEQS